MISYTKKRRRWVALLLTVLLLCSFWSPVSAQALDTAMDSDMLYTETAETISDEAADVAWPRHRETKCSASLWTKWNLSLIHI